MSMTLDKLRLDEDEGASSVINTPNETERQVSHVEPSSQTEQCSGSDLWVDSWNKAVDSCKDQLYPSDYEKVLQFGSAVELTDDLRLIEQEHRRDKAWLAGISRDVRPILTMLDEASQWFMICMRPVSIKVSILWGLLHLTIKLSIENERRWREMSRMLTAFKRQLEKCKVSAESFANQTELKNAFLDAFVALIKFWVEASKFMREKNNEPRTLDFLKLKFDSTLKEMDDAIINLKECAALRKVGVNDYRSLLQDKIMAASLPDSGGHETQDRTGQYSREQRYQIPYNNSNSFVGRAAYLDAIDSALNSEDRNQQRSFRIWGLGGVGKTQIALAYANASIKSFEAVFWIKAETEASLKRSFTDVALNLELEGASRTASPDDNRDAVLSWLLKCEMKWLLVFDNVDKLAAVKDYWPSSTGSVLLTTRIPQVARAARGRQNDYMCVEALDEGEAWDVFAHYMKDDDRVPQWQIPANCPLSEREAALSLLVQLGGLPLGIRESAALIKHKNWTVERYLQRYNKVAGDSRKLLGKNSQDFNFDQDYQYALENVWRMSFDTLSEDNDGDACGLLGVLALCYPENIPINLFQVSQSATLQPSFCWNSKNNDDDTFQDAKAELAGLALIDVHQENLSVHRLVQTAFIHYLTQPKLQISFENTSALLNAAFPKQIFGRPLIPQWADCSILAPHCISLASKYHQLKTARSLIGNNNLVELLSNCAWYLHEIGDWTDCSMIIEIAKEACRPEESLLYSHLLNTAGASLFELNKYTESRQNLEMALKIRRQHLPEDNEDLLCTKNNLANLESAEGKGEEALTLFKQVKAAREALGPATAVSLSLTLAGFARVHFARAEYAKSKAYWEQSLEIVTAAYGPRGHYVTAFCKELGCVALAEGRLEDAEALFGRSLDICVEKHPGHIETACLYYKMGVTQLRRCHLESALTNLEQAMFIAQRRRSEGDIARIVFVQSQVYGQLGDKDAALKAETALKIAESLKGKLQREQSTGSETKADILLSYDMLVCHFFR